MDYSSLEIKFKPIIQKLIDENKKSYGFDNQINWSSFVRKRLSFDSLFSCYDKFHKRDLKLNIFQV